MRKNPRRPELATNLDRDVVAPSAQSYRDDVASRERERCEDPLPRNPPPKSDRPLTPRLPFGPADRAAATSSSHPRPDHAVPVAVPHGSLDRVMPSIFPPSCPQRAGASAPPSSPHRTTSVNLPPRPGDRGVRSVPPSPSSHPPAAQTEDNGVPSVARPDTPERDLAGALHEVSNALTVVLGWLEAAREDIGQNHPGRRSIDIAWSRAKLARKLARRAIGDESESLEHEADLESIVRDAVTGVEREAVRQGQTLSVLVGPPSRGRVAKGAPALLQVLTNLLLNAIAMSPKGTKISVELDAATAEGRLFVNDEGPGIAPEHRAVLFEGRRSQRKGGAGIGLKHARALARANGGDLDLVPSERGARFCVGWPLVAMAAPVPRTSTIPNASLAGVRVLVLEDDESVIGLLTTALSLRGALVKAARSSEELQAALNDHHYDAALLDLSPIAADIGGALQGLHARSPRTKLVLISGSSAEVPAAAASMMSAWVRKPFEVGEVLAVLRNLPPIRIDARANEAESAAAS